MPSCSRHRFPFASVQLVWQRNACSHGRSSCRISRSAHGTRSRWSTPVSVGQRYDLFIGEPGHFAVSSVASPGQNFPGTSLTRGGSRSKSNCSRPTSSSGRMGHRKCWPAPSDSSMTAWWRREQSVLPFPTTFPSQNLWADPIREHPHWAIWFTCCGNSI